jgi:hypothetical protein
MLRDVVDVACGRVIRRLVSLGDTLRVRCAAQSSKQPSPGGIPSRYDVPFRDDIHYVDDVPFRDDIHYVDDVLRERRLAPRGYPAGMISTTWTMCFAKAASVCELPAASALRIDDSCRRCGVRAGHSTTRVPRGCCAIVEATDGGWKPPRFVSCPPRMGRKKMSKQ